MNNLNNSELRTVIDDLLAVIDAPDEDGVIFADENPYDLIANTEEIEVMPWCGTEVEEEPEKSGEYAPALLVFIGALLMMFLLFAWITAQVYSLLAFLGMLLWIAVHAL